MLRVTHLSRYREGWDPELGYDGWFLRFSGEDDAFNDMRDELKTWGRTWARWVPAYQWRDGREGAWWIDSGLFSDHYTEEFEGLQEAMDAILDGDVLQWIAPRRRPQRERRQKSSTSLIPVHLQQDYRVLGIGPAATLQDAKDAYRRQAKQYHPDAGGTHLGFITLQGAYEHVSQFLKMRERIAV
jgi:hypothetical protein